MSLSTTRFFLCLKSFKIFKWNCLNVCGNDSYTRFVSKHLPEFKNVCHELMVSLSINIKIIHLACYNVHNLYNIATQQHKHHHQQQIHDYFGAKNV